jgi:single-strand DNA-binding protein
LGLHQPLYMSGVNKVLLVGYIDKQPELKHLNGNLPILSFDMTTVEEFVKNGSKSEHKEWHAITMWRSLAEAAFEILQKGMLISIEGKLTTKHFIDKKGVKRYITEVVADKFTLVR